MRTLVIGSGAREHALCWKILQSSLLGKLFLFNPNDGFAQLGEVIEASSYYELAQIVESKRINLVVVGPEAPLVEGISDIFKEKGIRCIGADKYWSQLEGSKLFAKEFMKKYGIKTAEYEAITSDVLPRFGYPFVLKADGLCGGKGVCIVNNEQEAKINIKEYLGGKFQEASKTIIAEEFLDGQELSLIYLFDGETLLPFVPARDFKKLENGDKGPNTGGMGAFCPVDLSLVQNQKLQIFSDSLKEALIAEKADFSGVIYAGLIWSRDDFYVLEFNMRFGDPETQCLMMHLKTDILEVFKACINKQLKNITLSWKEGHSGCLTIASKGYPNYYKKGISIEEISDEVEVFYAGVKKNNGFISNGGRVLSFCNSGKNPYAKIYCAAKKLQFSEKYYRTDIDIC